MITAIEGNRGEKVDRRVIPLGWGYIRGYAAPRYEKAYFFCLGFQTFM